MLLLHISVDVSKGEGNMYIMNTWNWKIGECLSHHPGKATVAANDWAECVECYSMDKQVHGGVKEVGGR